MLTKCGAELATSHQISAIKYIYFFTCRKVNVPANKEQEQKYYHRDPPLHPNNSLLTYYPQRTSGESDASHGNTSRVKYLFCCFSLSRSAAREG